MRHPALWLMALALAANACQEARPTTGPADATRADSVRSVFVRHDTTLIDSPIERPGTTRRP